MKTLLRDSVKNQVYEIIRRKILSQEYNLGEKINMLQLSKELQVSNTPIREALSMLEKDGLVVTQQNAGPKVIEVTKECFCEITEAVMTLLLGAYELCLTKNLTADLIDMMSEKLDYQKQYEEQGTDYEFAEASISFDACLIKVAHNDKLRHFFEGLFDLLFLIVLYDHQNVDVDRKANIKEHEKILEAIKESDENKVRQLIKNHYARMPKCE